MTQAIRPSSITCARCGTDRKVGQRGPLPTYCSAECRSANGYANARADGRIERGLHAQREVTRLRRIGNARPCPYCSAPMLSPRAKQCGAPDCKRSFNADRMRQWNRAYRQEHGAWYAGLNYSEGQRSCEKRRRQEKGHWRRLYPERAATYDARRRALVEQARTAETFAPIDVHTRDNWTCKLCLLPIDSRIAWPDPKSPSVDHVVPLSRGGAHAMHNVQSAHLGCNSSKGGRVLNEWLLACRA